MVDYLIGIDGGGTSCRAAVADRTGRILGMGKSGSANIMTSADIALANIDRAAREAFSSAGLNQDLIRQCPAFLGLAGNNVEDAVVAVSSHLPFSRAIIDSDGLIALQGALGEGDGAVAILGTGSIFIARTGTDVRYLGGWGFFIGDFGSGARLGQMALQESLLAFDEIIASSPLTASILGEFEHSPPRMVAFAKQASPGDFGRFAPRMFEFAKLGDAVAQRLLKTAATQVDAALDRMAEITKGGRLSLLGGLATPYAPYLAERHQSRLIDAKADALTGAVALARLHFIEEAAHG
jgi:glucosamine kinase